MSDLEDIRTWLQAVISDARTASTKIDALIAKQDKLPLSRVRFACPLGGQMQANGQWPVGIFSATNYAQYYTSSGSPAYHTGCDLNHVDVNADVNASAYAAADGQIMYVGVQAGWQGQIVIERVLLEDGTYVYARYAHIAPIVNVGDIVHLGQKIGTLVDYAPTGKASGDHLHFVIAKIDLGRAPDDWPGNDRARVLRDYLDPLQVLKDHP